MRVVTGPMLATQADAPLADPNLVYEPKYDGIRALAAVEPRAGAAPRVSLSSRLGNDKTAQFPEVVQALQQWGARRRHAALLDGEIVALNADGKPLGFQRLQDRIHLTAARDIARVAAERPVAFIAFDLLHDGDDDLTPLPLRERRKRLEAVLAAAPAGDGALLRLAPQVEGNGEALLAQAQAEGWEGLIVKDARSPYKPGQRSRDWRKLKLVKRQEFVVGGWTEPRRSRARFGALLLGIPEGAAGKLRYVGHSGSGFTEKELDRVARLLAARAIDECPFTELPPSNEAPHWVRPELVAEVKFTEWTDEGYLRHPIYLGLRDDVSPADVRREEAPGPAPRAGRTSHAAVESGAAPAPTAGPAPAPAARDRARLARDLLALEREAGSGRLALPAGVALDLTNLRKPLWRDLGITKGELLRYYLAVSPQILPVVRDRPLVMRRSPDGFGRPFFYQHRAPDEVPPGVRAEAVPGEDVPRFLVGGSLLTLLYMTQLGAISQDPWFSRAQSPAEMDFAAIDLDPMPEASFSRVLDVARWVRDELATLGAAGYAKTSGSRGLHVCLPMRQGTPYEAGLLFSQMVSTLVARRHPREATVERTVGRRDPGAVYLDYLQNIRGKTLACAYSARASAHAGASAPVTWEEIDATGTGTLDPRALTIRTLPARVEEVGDLWSRFRLDPGVDLAAALDRAQSRHG
jgi:bifunctional non-homologous end joining protein LigD